MKNSIKVLLLLFVISLTFDACKKGEDDPFISFRSRTKRLTGDWELKSADYDIIEKTSNTHVAYHYTYDGVKIKINRVTSVNNDVYTQTYYEDLNFRKDGTFSQIFDYNGDTESYKGHWFWSKKNKDLGLKNKEAVFLTFTKEPSGTASGKSNPAQVTLVFKRLSNKEIITEFDYTFTDNDGLTRRIMGTKTYEQD